MKNLTFCAANCTNNLPSWLLFVAFQALAALECTVMDKFCKTHKTVLFLYLLHFHLLATIYTDKDITANN